MQMKTKLNHEDTHIQKGQREKKPFTFLTKEIIIKMGIENAHLKDAMLY